MMKEQYIAPELELLSLTPAERLASSNDEIDFDSMLGGSGNAASVHPEIDIEIPLN